MDQQTKRLAREEENLLLKFTYEKESFDLISVEVRCN